MNTTNIITRVGHCSLCEKTRQPRTGQKFLAYGSHKQQWHVMEADHNGRIGYTPHIYKGKVNGENVIVEIACAMYGCGCDRKWEKDYWFYFIKHEDYRREIWSLERWNALVLYKHDRDYEV